MQVIKRDCTLVEFDKNKIYNAIMNAMTNGSGIVKETIAKTIADEIELDNKDNDEIEISEIESQVFDKLLKHKQKLTAKAYEGYRKIREYQRNTTNSTDESIIELLSGRNNYLNRENSNKNATLVTTQRDYMAGEVSKEGEFFVRDDGFCGQNRDESILDYNVPPSTQPGLWCQWVINGNELEWDGGEKFYNYVEWLEYLIENFFKPWGVTINGEVEWSGESRSDIGKIVVTDNKVQALEGRIEY